MWHDGRSRYIFYIVYLTGSGSPFDVDRTVPKRGDTEKRAAVGSPFCSHEILSIKPGK